jgi:peptidoglycan/xylan/chitin deacetylase (PgdA/CDA1 family)
LKIAVEAPPADGEIILELLSPWDIAVSTLDEADITIFYKQKPSTTKASIIVPSDHESFLTWAKEIGLEITRKNECITYVNATSQTTLTIMPKTQYWFSEFANVGFEDETPTDIHIKNGKSILKLDLVQEFRAIIDGVLHPKQSGLHRIFTGLPIPYGLAPKRLRDYFMKADEGFKNLSLCDKLPIDALRFILVNAIKKTSSVEITKKPLLANSSVYCLTHDVETSTGLLRSKVLKKVEEKYDIISAWYVPSNRYDLNNDLIKTLSNYGEVGSHDTKHDGKLIHLKKQELVKRLIDSKQTIEKIIQKPVSGFRAPILQHNHTIIQAINDAGYLYDTSVPTWEPKHPYTMKPHGIGTVFPMTINDLAEVPITLPQDHQLLYALGLTPKEVIQIWSNMTNVIQDLNGLVMFLVHPDYAMAADIGLYEELIGAIANEPKCTVTIPSRMSALMKE